MNCRHLLVDPGRACSRAGNLWHRALAFAVAAAALAALQPAAAQASNPVQPFSLASTPTLLPKTVLPSRVELTLDLDPDSAQFDGEATLHVQVLEPVRAIVLHARDLQPGALELLGGGAARALRIAPPVAADTPPVPDTWRLEPVDGGDIAAGAYRLHLRWRGTVQRSADGLYGVPYTAAGKPQRLLSTQLEEINARRLMPAFDEPVFRAVFELTVRAPAGYEVLSNTPQVLRKEEGTRVLWQFAPTPPMPCYLLAVTVGRLDHLAGEVDGVPLRIFTVPGRRDEAKYAMQATRELLPYYRRYFGRPYALAKLDQVAVPGVRSGAMEDWGLISYIEGALLFDPARSPLARQRRVYSTVAHEIAHQWFGNLVSVASWNEIWLNEAFATWMEQKAMRALHPEWQTELTVRRDLGGPMSRDVTAATRAIRSGPVSESTVYTIFDSITYSKGGAVLTMLEQWLGEEVFQRGLAAYMADRAMQPATAGDLWRHMSAAAGLPLATVATVAGSWTDQAGLPLLQVDANCRDGTTQVLLRQQRLSEGDPLPPQLWQMPVVLARGEQRRAVLLQQPEQRFELAGCDDAQPLRANAGAGGYYRVLYAPALQQRLVNDFARLPAVERLALLSDSEALVATGHRALAAHLALLPAVGETAGAERAALLLQVVRYWGRMRITLAGSSAEAAWREAGQRFFAPELQRLGLEPMAGEPQAVTDVRGALLELLGRLDHAPTLALGQANFAAALDVDSAVHPSLRAVWLELGARRASDAQFASLLAALHSATRDDLRWRYLGAAAASSNPAHARRLLEEALSGRLPPQLSSAIPGFVAAQPQFSVMAYEFAIEHFAALTRVTSDDGRGKWGLLAWVGSGLSDPAWAARLRADQARLLGPDGAAPAARGAAAIEGRARLRARESAGLPAMLAQWPPGR